MVGGYDLQEQMTFFINNAQLSILLKTEGIFNCNLMLYRRGRQRRKLTLGEPAEDSTTEVRSSTELMSSILKNCFHILCGIILNRPGSFYRMFLIIIFIVLSFSLQIYVSFISREYN